MSIKEQYKLAYGHARIVHNHNSSYAHYEQVTKHLSTIAVDNAWCSMCLADTIENTGRRYRTMLVNPGLKYSNKTYWREYCHWLYHHEI